MHPYISIVIPTRNNEKDLIDCLDSIRNLEYPFDKIEIIIWDNDSNPECKEQIKIFCAHMRNEKAVRVEFIEHNNNYGVYTSRDELFRLINNDAQFVLSIDDDVILPPQIFNELLRLFEKDKSIGIVGPRTVFDDIPAETAHGAGFTNWWLGRYSEKDSKQTIECDYVIGCCMFIRKKVVSEIGGFDRDYYTSHGEVDFCLKAKNKGFQIVYYPGVVVRHRVERGGTKSLERRYYLYRNKLFVIKKNSPLPQKYISLSLYFLFWLPKIFFESIISNRGIDYQELQMILKAMVDGWLNRVGKRV